MTEKIHSWRETTTDAWSQCQNWSRKWSGNEWARLAPFTSWRRHNIVSRYSTRGNRDESDLSPVKSMRRMSEVCDEHSLITHSAFLRKQSGSQRKLLRNYTNEHRHSVNHHDTLSFNQFDSLFADCTDSCLSAQHSQRACLLRHGSHTNILFPSPPRRFDLSLSTPGLPGMRAVLINGCELIRRSKRAESHIAARPKSLSIWEQLNVWFPWRADLPVDSCSGGKRPPLPPTLHCLYRIISADNTH